MIIDIKDQADFNSIISLSNSLIIDFYAPWCMPCTKLTPQLESLANEEKYKDVVFAKVNIDKSEFNDLVETLEISSIPLLQFYHKGKLVSTVLGTKMTAIIDNLNKIL
jgi:thioredoxin